MLAPLINGRWISLLVHVSCFFTLFCTLGFADEGGSALQVKGKDIISNGMFRLITQEEEAMTRIPPTPPMAAGTTSGGYQLGRGGGNPLG